MDILDLPHAVRHASESVSAETWQLSALIHARQQYAPKRLEAPGPTARQIAAYFAAAAAAPDHGQITPWRFVVVPEAARGRLGEAFAAALRERDAEAPVQALEEARAKAHRAPFLALAIARLPGDAQADDIPQHERLVSLGAALQNMLLSAQADGFGSGLVSGQAMQSRALRNLFGLSAQEIAVCFIAIGTVTRRKPGRVRPAVESFVSTLPDN